MFKKNNFEGTFIFVNKPFSVNNRRLFGNDVMDQCAAIAHGCLRDDD